jgi:hypothetical protein
MAPYRAGPTQGGAGDETRLAAGFVLGCPDSDVGLRGVRERADVHRDADRDGRQRAGEHERPRRRGGGRDDQPELRPGGSDLRVLRLLPDRHDDVGRSGMHGDDHPLELGRAALRPLRRSRRQAAHPDVDGVAVDPGRSEARVPLRSARRRGWGRARRGDALRGAGRAGCGTRPCPKDTCPGRDTANRRAPDQPDPRPDRAHRDPRDRVRGLRSESAASRLLPPDRDHGPLPRAMGLPGPLALPGRRRPPKRPRRVRVRQLDAQHSPLAHPSRASRAEAPAGPARVVNGSRSHRPQSRPLRSSRSSPPAHSTSPGRRRHSSRRRACARGRSPSRRARGRGASR